MVKIDRYPSGCMMFGPDRCCRFYTDDFVGGQRIDAMAIEVSRPGRPYACAGSCGTGEVTRKQIRVFGNHRIRRGRYH